MSRIDKFLLGLECSLPGLLILGFLTLIGFITYRFLLN